MAAGEPSTRQLRVAVVGATGNVGTSVLRAVRDEPRVAEIVAVARRPATFADPRVRFVAADVARDPLDGLLAGLDAVVHLAWLIQPSHDDAALHAVNVEGSRRVFEAAARAGAAILYASSVGAYSPGPKDRAVDESWPTDGIDSLFYARHKAEAERILDDVEQRHPGLRIVRMRPGLIFKREAATGIRRLFAGPLLPPAAARPALIAAIPDIARLRFQAVHSHDVGEAFRLALVGDASGAFNLAAEPVLDPERLADVLGARRLRIAPGLLRLAMAASWHARLQPSPPGWLDLALSVPVMDATRARDVLGWRPEHSSEDALLDLLGGIGEDVDHPTPPLSHATAGRLRVRELVSLIAGRPRS